MPNINSKILYFLYNADGNNNGRVKEIVLDVIPDKVSHSYNANWTAQDFLGRMSPIHIYKNGTVETYAFSVILHEDINAGSNSSIVSLIDDIKSLSYPIFTASGGQLMPRTYFQLGEIAGFGLVSTSVEWNKPFRDGRYIYVTVNFTITIDEKVVSPRVVKMYEQNVSNDDYFANAQIISQFTTTQMNSIISSLGGVAEFITDVIDPADASGLDAYKFGWATQEYDYARTRLSNLYTAFSSQEIDMSGLSFLGRLLSRDLTGSAAFVSTLTDSQLTTIFNGYISKFNEFFDEYYENNENITPDEKQRVKDEFAQLILTIKDISKEAIGYGASS